jgi:hypothetical protein
MDPIDPAHQDRRLLVRDLVALQKLARFLRLVALELVAGQNRLVGANHNSAKFRSQYIRHSHLGKPAQVAWVQLELQHKLRQPRKLSISEQSLPEQPPQFELKALAPVVAQF